MTIIAYASADPDPVSNPNVDAIIDLSATPLPGLSVQLYGSQVDSVDVDGPFTYQWTILAEPDVGGNPGTLNTATSQNPILEDIDVWGNYRLFLVVTNTDTAETSEVDPLLAPDSAFVVVRLLSVDKGLQKIAAGERNWFDDHYDLVQVVEDLPPGGADTVNEHSDVANATGADLDVLVSQGLADDPDDPGHDLHTHLGTSVPLATAVAQGTVVLEEAGNAKVITQERVVLQGDADGSQVASSGYLPGIIVPPDYDGDSGTFNGGGWHCAWRIREVLNIQEYTVTMQNGGPAAPTTDYSFDLYTASSEANLRNKVLVKLNKDVTAGVGTRPAADGGPMTLRRTADFPTALGVDTYLLLVCEAAPKVSEGDQPGGGLSVQVHCHRPVG